MRALRNPHTGAWNVNSGAFLTAIQEYGMAAVFLMILLEYACFPVPSEVVLPFSGAFAGSRGIPFWQLLLGSVAAGLLGSLLCYLAGRFGGRLVARLEKRFTGVAKGVAAARGWFDRYGGASVMFGRVLPVCRTYISFAAGLSRQPVARFLGYSAVGIAVWNLVLTGLGYRLAAHWGAIAVLARKYTYALLPLVAVLILAVILRIRASARKSG